LINDPAKSLEFRAIDAIQPRLINQPERPNRLNAISCQDRGARGGIPRSWPERRRHRSIQSTNATVAAIG
jgi:hypothetical protein